MDRLDFFFRMLVGENHLDSVFDKAEQADRDLVTDAGLVGVWSGGIVSEKSGTPNISVDVSGPLVAYDQDGQRVQVSSLQNVDVSVDDSATTTAVSGGGNEKWLSLVVKFARLLADPEVDGNSSTVYTTRDESYDFSVVQGSEAPIGTATRPALPSDGLLLADIRRTQGQTQIFNADISITRRQDAFVIAGTPLAIARGQVEQAISDIVAAFNAHVTGAANDHLASDVSYAGGGSWAGGTSPTNPAASVEAQLDKIITDLSATTSSASGAHRIGTQAAGNWYNNLNSGAAQSAGTLYSVLAGVVADLASTANGLGAARVGCYARTAWLRDSTTNPLDSVGGAIDKIITDLSVNNNAAACGASKIGFTPAGAIAADTVQAAITELDTEKVGFTTLADAVGVGANGAALVGFAPQGMIAASTVEAALAELDTEKAALAGATFTGEVVLLRESVGSTIIGVIAANTQITNSVGYVEVQIPASAVSLNVALPAPSSGFPLLNVNFVGTTPAGGRNIYITNTANLSTSNPTDYYGGWFSGATARGGYTFAWNGSAWKILHSTGGVSPNGGGTLAS